MLEVALERGGHLLTAGERVVVDAILALPPGPARLFALLSNRRREAWPIAELTPPGVDDPADAIEVLVARGLADHLVPWRVRADGLPRAALVEACARLGLPTTGNRAERIERLAGRRGFTGPWLRVRHRGLIRRLEQWALLRKEPDRSVLVVERLGHVRWPTYTLTTGTTLFRDRRALLAWERLLGGVSVDEALAAAAEGHHVAPGRLDLGRRLGDGILAVAVEHERSGELDRARSLYLRAADILGAQVAVRVARTLEVEGRPKEALDHLLSARLSARGADRIAIDRMGRRLAGALRRGWPPSRPLASPRVRDLTLDRVDRPGPRPLYDVDGAVVPVERAVVRALAAAGREALHTENALWTTLFALLFAEAYFLPIPGALPARFLAGPLDLGTPTFRSRRADTIAAILRAVRRGEGPERVRRADAELRGVRLAGASWSLADGETLARITEGLGGPALASVLEHLLDEGWAASRGLPDLTVLPGPAVQLPRSHPSRLGPGLLLVEIKGPGDTLRDHQLAWLDRLLALGAPVERWEVRGAAAVGSIARPSALIDAADPVRASLARADADDR